MPGQVRIRQRLPGAAHIFHLSRANVLQLEGRRVPSVQRHVSQRDLVPQLRLWTSVLTLLTTLYSRGRAARPGIRPSVRLQIAAVIRLRMDEKLIRSRYQSSQTKAAAAEESLKPARGGHWCTLTLALVLRCPTFLHFPWICS